MSLCMVKDLLTSSACQEMAQEYLATNSIQQEIIQEFAPALGCVRVAALRQPCCITHIWLVATCLIEILTPIITHHYNVYLGSLASFN